MSMKIGRLKKAKKRIASKAQPVKSQFTHRDSFLDSIYDQKPQDLPFKDYSKKRKGRKKKDESDSQDKTVDILSSPSRSQLDNLIPGLNNELHGKGRGATLPSFLEVDQSATLEELIGPQPKSSSRKNPTPKKKRAIKQKAKLNSESNENVNNSLIPSYKSAFTPFGQGSAQPLRIKKSECPLGYLASDIFNILKPATEIEAKQAKPEPGPGKNLLAGNILE